MRVYVAAISQDPDSEVFLFVQLVSTDSDRGPCAQAEHPTSSSVNHHKRLKTAETLFLFSTGSIVFVGGKVQLP